MVNPSVKSPYYIPEHTPLSPGALTTLQFGLAGLGLGAGIAGEISGSRTLFQFLHFNCDHPLESEALHLPLHHL